MKKQYELTWYDIQSWQSAPMKPIEDMLDISLFEVFRKPPTHDWYPCAIKSSDGTVRSGFVRCDKAHLVHPYNCKPLSAQSESSLFSTEEYNALGADQPALTDMYSATPTGWNDRFSLTTICGTVRIHDDLELGSFAFSGPILKPPTDQENKRHLMCNYFAIIDPMADGLTPTE